MSFDDNHLLYTGNGLFMGNPVQNIPVHPVRAAGHIPTFGGVVPPLVSPWTYYGNYPQPNLMVLGGLPHSAFGQSQQLQTMPSPQSTFVPLRKQEESRTDQAKRKISFDVYDPGNFEARLRKMIEEEGSCNSPQHKRLGHKDNDWTTGKDVTELGVPKTSVMVGDPESSHAHSKRKRKASSQENNREDLRCESKSPVEHERKDAGKRQISKRKKEKGANNKNESKKKRADAEQAVARTIQGKGKNRKQVTSGTSAATNAGSTEVSQTSRKKLVQQLAQSIQVFHELGPKPSKGDSGDKKVKNLQTPTSWRTCAVKDSPGLGGMHEESTQKNTAQERATPSPAGELPICSKQLHLSNRAVRGRPNISKIVAFTRKLKNRLRKNLQNQLVRRIRTRPFPKSHSKTTSATDCSIIVVPNQGEEKDTTKSTTLQQKVEEKKTTMSITLQQKVEETETTRLTTLQQNEANGVPLKSLQHNTSPTRDDWSLMGFMNRMGLKTRNQ
ncbi:uncharacterized protein LOC143522579 [Brachyhypopomus gauderio]|uniref:uncharacterized protein LOC143522579 n=1 Tax=Brachyhypopomus gauderio TaxID=698409 RepID=UPI004041C721